MKALKKISVLLLVVMMLATSAYAAAIAAGITAGSDIGLIVGIVVVAGGTLTVAAFFVAAYTSTISADYNYNRFKASL